MSERGLIMEVMDLLAQLRADAKSPREERLLEVAIDAMLFITSTGQRYALEDYLEHLESNGPPLVVATFKTPEEAQAWLSNHPQPPDMACVLIGDRYHLVVYNRKLDYRHLVPHSAMEYHLGSLKQGGLPPPAASFNTREEAQAWLEGQAKPPSQSVIQVAGEPYLAVYHHKINHGALYPFSIAIEVAEEP
jgi:hypothetical protein